MTRHADDRFDEQAADMEGALDKVLIRDGHDPLVQSGKVGWKSDEASMILHEDALVGLTGAKIVRGDPLNVTSTYFSAASIGA